jgi:heme/copper-type cytochrome/quinol oxidase subunit 2
VEKDFIAQLQKKFYLVRVGTIVQLVHPLPSVSDCSNLANCSECGPVAICAKNSYKQRDLIYIVIAVIALFVAIVVIALWRTHDRKRKAKTARLIPSNLECLL